ncbi:MAG: hypothetical protein ABL889_19565 [Terricaulis sp.]
MTKMFVDPYTPRTKRELLGTHATIFLLAPDNFVPMPNARPGEETTLESIFAEAHRGVDHVFRKERHNDVKKRMHEVLDKTYAEFKAGRRSEARKMCHELEDLIVETRP